MQRQSFYRRISNFSTRLVALMLKSTFESGKKKKKKEKKKYHWRWSLAFEDTPITQSVDVHQNTCRFSIFYTLTLTFRSSEKEGGRIKKE